MKNDTHSPIFIDIEHWMNCLLSIFRYSGLRHREIFSRPTILSSLIVTGFILFSLFSECASAGGWIRRLADADTNVHRIGDANLPINERAGFYFQQHSSPDNTNNYFLARDAIGVTHLVNSNGHMETFDSHDELMNRIDDIGNPAHRSTIAMVERDYFYFRDQLAYLSNGEIFKVVLNDGEITKAKSFLTSDKVEMGLELESKIILQGGSPSILSKAKEFLNVKFNTRDVKVLSLFSGDDFVANRRIAFAGKELHTDIARESSQNIAKLVSSFKRKIVIVVGHVEGPNFVIRKADGSATLTLPIADLERAAINADSSLILLGCNTSKLSNSSGLLSTTTDIDVANSISLAIASSDYGEFFTHLAGTDAPFLLKADTLAGQDRLRMERQRSQIRENQLSTLYVSTIIVAGLSPAKSAVLRSRIIFFLPNSFVSMYLGGIFLTLTRVQSLWMNWSKLWPLAPATAINPVITRLAISLKWLIFAVFAPLVLSILLLLIPIAIVMFFIPFVPWSAPLRLLKYCVFGKTEPHAPRNYG